MYQNTEGFANLVYDILEKLGGAAPSQRIPFVYEHLESKYRCLEWRFMGKLGMGGKYRSERNKVDYYPEDETPEMVEATNLINAALKKLETKHIVYVDMDGVVADFNAEIMKVNPTIFEHEDGDYRGKVIDEICEADVNIFQRLQPIPGAIDAINKLKDHYEIYFLSTPMWNVPHSFTDKRLWIVQHFGDLATKRLILTHRKDLNVGSYLIDDRLKNGAAEFTGKHIHFGTNEFPDWNSVEEYLLPK